MQPNDTVLVTEAYSEHTTAPDIFNSVSRLISVLEPEDRRRVLKAVACLYDIDLED